MESKFLSYYLCESADPSPFAFTVPLFDVPRPTSNCRINTFSTSSISHFPPTHFYVWTTAIFGLYSSQIVKLPHGTPLMPKVQKSKVRVLITCFSVYRTLDEPSPVIVMICQWGVLFEINIYIVAGDMRWPIETMDSLPLAYIGPTIAVIALLPLYYLIKSNIRNSIVKKTTGLHDLPNLALPRVGKRIQGTAVVCGGRYT